MLCRAVLTTEVSVQGDEWFPVLRFIPFLNAETALRSSGTQSRSKACFAAAESPFTLELAFLANARHAFTPRRWAEEEGWVPAGCFLSCPSDTCLSSRQE